MFLFILHCSTLSIIQMIHKPILLLLCLSYISPFYFFVDDVPLCVGIQRPSETLNFAYDVSSEDPENVHVEIIDQRTQVLRTFTGRQNFTTIQSSEPFHICFSTSDGTEKAISWDLWLDSTTEIKKLASKSDMSLVHTTLMEASNILRTVSQHQKFQEEREFIHVGIITDAQDAVKFWGIVKVLVIIGLVGLQFAFVKFSLKAKDGQMFI